MNDRPGTGRSRASSRSVRAAGAMPRASTSHGARNARAQRDNGNIIAHNYGDSNRRSLPKVTAPASVRSRGRGGPSTPGGDTAARLARLESMLASMQRDRSQLAESLRQEVSRRERVENELRGVKAQMGASVRAQTAQKQKLQAYQEAMRPLVSAMSRRAQRG